tara:strand:- start:3787 stop:3978 length:192 start_codon:yes stop_codon:yes gene_type:complete
MGSSKTVYPDGVLDFFVLVCLDLELLYIVPIDEVFGHRGVSIWANVKSSGSRFEKYREAWNQF